MPYAASFRPAAHGAFLPQVRLAGSMTRQVAYPVQPFLGQVRMGVTTEEWYKRASASLERYRFLKSQIQSVNNDVGRQSLTMWLGTIAVDESPEYRYATVLSDFNDAKKTGLTVYDIDRRTGRIEKLENINDQFNQKIEAARISYGTRDVPATTPPGGTPGGQQPPTKTPDLTVPLLVAGAAVAVAIIFG